MRGSSVEIARPVQVYLRTGSWTDSQDYNPVERERGVTWLRYDAIRIGNSRDSEAGVLVQFLWRGWAVAWERIDGAHLDAVRHFTSEGMAGRLRVTG